MLLLHIGEDAYAIPMETAREVLVGQTLTPLPAAPSSVLGLCNVRGEILPVFDTAALLGTGPMDALTAIAIVETSLGLAGLAASDTGEAIELGEPAGPTEGPGTAGAFAIGADVGVAVLIDVEALLAPARVAG